MSNNLKAADNSRIDWMITLVPFILIMGLAVYLFIFPEQANVVISQVRFLSCWENPEKSPNITSLRGAR